VKAPADSQSPDRPADRPSTSRRDAPDVREKPDRRDGEVRPVAAAVQRLQQGAGNRAVAALLAARRAGQGRPGGAAAGPGRVAGPARAPAPAGSGTVQAASTGTTDGAGPAASGVELAGPAVQRLAEGAAPAGRSGPGSDPKFAALKANVRGKQKLLSAHPPASSEAAKAQGAAKPPQDDVQAQGKAANAEKMNAAKPGEFDKAGFIKAVNDAIAQQAPKNLDEADSFGESGKADGVKAQVQGKVGDGRKTSAAAIETATKAPPDTAAAKPKTVTPLQPDQPPGTPATPDPAQAVPDKAPPAATDFSAGPKQVNDQLADAQVSEDQLKRSNEPEFTDALAAKKDGEQHAATAPGVVRGKEAATLAGAKAQAQQASTTAMTALATDRRQAGAQVAQGKDGAKGSDESRRAQVTAKLQTVFDATQKDVEAILTGLDKKVDDTFTSGEKAARDAFTAEHSRKMDAYKDARYSGWTGKLRWVKDKFAGLPEEANQIFVQARQGYVTRMQAVISSVADVIGAELGRAKQRIATGRDQLQAEVRKLPADLQAIGKQAAGDFAGKFDQLTESVDAKGTELVNTLASKYNDALKSVDAEIEAEKEKNQGLVAKAVNAVKGVIGTILKLKDLLLGVLAKAASAVMAILKDPIGFLGNLVSAVGAGLRNFIANIGAHLKKGLIGWLMGSLADAGIQLPERFDLRGILGMVASMLGLTWAAIRGRIISRGVPDQAMTAVESSVPIAQKIQSGGIAGIWEDLKERIGDLKATLFAKISEYLIPTVLIAGITWIVSLLNPASAFIKACKMIIDIVTFILDRGAQIIEFVSSVLDAVIAIAGGGSGGVPALIENALAKSVPVLIGALAAILGIGGIADKVKKFFQSLSKPVMKAVDWVVDKIAGFGKRIWAKMKGFGGKVRDKLTGKGKANSASPEEKEKRLDLAVSKGVQAVNKYAGRPVAKALLTPMLAGIRLRYGLKSLAAVQDGDSWAVAGEINPTKTVKADAKVAGADATGAVAAYRGIHFKVTWDAATYDRNLRQSLIGKPDFSWAAKELAGSRTPDGTDVPEGDLLAAAQLVQDRVKQTKDPSAVRGWWRSRPAVFDSLFLAMLQRYVNAYDAFEKEMANPPAQLGGMGFTKIPFISTSKKAGHSAAYALGQKFLPDAEVRKSGTVGRVFVYVFSLADLHKQDPANIEQVQDSGKVRIRARIIHEGEVTFTGYIPGENRVAEVDAKAGEDVGTVAARAEGAAGSHAGSLGGLKEWD
jgi:hypothetical protein